VVGDFLVGPEHATEILREMREQGHAEIGAHLHPLTEALAGSVDVAALAKVMEDVWAGRLVLKGKRRALLDYSDLAAQVAPLLAPTHLPEHLNVE